MKRRSQHILRMLSFAMALVMVLGMLPAGARAEETATEHEHVYKAGKCTVEGCTESKLDEGWLVPDFPVLEEGDYTMVLIPDTQHLVNSHVQGYYDLMKWIADNKAERNIVAAMGMGDMIQRNSDAAYIEAEYKICVEGTQYLTNAGIPWMPMMGNHDYERIDYFRKAFPYEEYGSNRSWFGGSYYKDNLDHTYWFVTAGEREYMILSLGYAPSQAVLDWAASVVENYPFKSVIINAHDIVNYNGSFLDTGTRIWNTLGGYPNVVMSACGHIDKADLVTRTDTNGAGNTVYSILADAQGQDQVTDTNTDYVGMLALLTFDKDSNTVDVNWYSTHYDAFYGENNQFPIEVPHVYRDHTCTFETETVEATCTESGGDKNTCTFCGHTYYDNEVKPLGHSYGDPVYTERIGSKPSYTTVTCTRCSHMDVEYGEVTMSAVSYAAPAGAQDGAIWDGKIFQTDAGKCYVYDLEKQATVDTFKLDGTDAIVAHGNAACFGSTYYAEGDKYPLLYVGVWKQYETQPDMTGTCCVYRIIENADGSFSSELVQVIKIGFAQNKELWDSDDERPFGTFVVDTDENKLYVTVGRVNHSRFFCFDIPAVTEGTYNESYRCNVVTLTKEKIRYQFDTAYINYPQGASYHGGQIYIQESYGSTRKLTVVDLKAQAVVYTHDMVKEGLSGASYLLAFDPDTADLYYGAPDYTGAKKLYKLTFYGEKDQIPEMVYESLGTIPGAQDGAIWNGKLFQPVPGKLHVYDMETKTTVQTLTLENFGSLTVHGNSVCFGSTANLKEGEYPLLYVGLWTRIASVDGSCCVYRITEENGTFSTDLVQVIKIGFGNDTELWKSGYSRPYATYAADGENNKLYAMVTRDTEPCTRVFEFEIPDATEGTYNENGYYELTLTKDDIQDQFDTAPVYMPQGACYYHGKIYIQESSTPGIPSVLKVIDLESRKISYSYAMEDADDALLAKQATMICVDPADGEMYYGVQDGSTCYLYWITEGHTYTAVVTTERTCTTDGVTTYTCTCGYTYTEVIPAIGHSYVDGVCENCGEKELEIYQESYGKTSARQDGAIWNGKLFQPAGGTCSVYDLTTKNTKTFDLDDTNGILAHGNTACFGSTYYAEGDEYPLLYVSVWKQYESAADKKEGTCCVYRIVEHEDGSFSSELVQVIEIGFADDERWASGNSRPYGTFVVDTDQNKLYAMVMRDAEQTNRVFAFDIPAVTEGTYNESYGCNVVTLEQTDIKDQFDTEYVNFQQGACYYNGKIYTQESFVQNKVPPVLKVIDLSTKTVTHSYDMTAAGISEQATLVSVDPADGAMYYGTDDGKLYKLTPHAEGCMHTFAVTTEPTCTEEGVMTYTCACGDSYTEAIPAKGHTIVDGTCVVCGLTFPVAVNTATGVTYSKASQALDEAVSGQTVQVLLDHTDSNLIVPAGVTLDMNGCVVTAKNVLSFGVVMDSQTEVGGIRIPIDTAQAFTKLQRGNGGYLPVYDTTDGMYKFFEYTLVNAGHKLEETCVAFGFKIQFTNMDAYSVLAATENSGISLTINLQWTDMTVPYIPHRITDSTITEYGEAVATTRSISKAMVIRVYGLDNLPVGGYVKAAPVLDTIAEVGAANDSEEFVKAQ